MKKLLTLIALLAITSSAFGRWGKKDCGSCEPKCSPCPKSTYIKADKPCCVKTVCKEVQVKPCVWTETIEHCACPPEYETRYNDNVAANVVNDNMDY